VAVVGVVVGTQAVGVVPELITEAPLAEAVVADVVPELITQVVAAVAITEVREVLRVTEGLVLSLVVSAQGRVRMALLGLGPRRRRQRAPGRARAGAREGVAEAAALGRRRLGVVCAWAGGG
jgi:xanthosine utilization system XapX-like protein